MNLYDPARPRIGNLPGISKSQILPRLTIWPDETDATKTRISAMVPTDEPFTSHEITRSVSTSGLPQLIQAYRDEPEEFFRTIFGVILPPPASANHNKQSNTGANLSTDELGI